MDFRKIKPYFMKWGMFISSKELRKKFATFFDFFKGVLCLMCSMKRTMEMDV